MADFETEVSVLGIGNVLWADEGFGVRAVEALHDAWEMPAGGELVDGGTQGMLLLNRIETSRCVLVLDAVDFGLAPGELLVLRDRDVPNWAGTKMSLHQQSFQDLLAIADLHERFPPRLTLIGVQPESMMDFGGSLTPPVRGRLAEALERAVAELASWGYAPRRRTAPAAERLNDASLSLVRYEGGRPSEEEACRRGDARFLGIRMTAMAGEEQR
ncbi:MAG: HyaD/HybD family hydrogenase maturation endopeptidase [Betaproteobacteria bacterium]